MLLRHGFIPETAVRSSATIARYVLGFAKEAIAHLKGHRLQREAKVIAAMRARPKGTLEEWVEIAYDDVPPRMWPMAKRSLLAHVQRIDSLQLAR